MNMLKYVDCHWSKEQWAVTVTTWMTRWRGAMCLCSWLLLIIGGKIRQANCGWVCVCLRFHQLLAPHTDIDSWMFEGLEPAQEPPWGCWVWGCPRQGWGREVCGAIGSFSWAHGWGVGDLLWPAASATPAGLAGVRWQQNHCMRRWWVSAIANTGLRSWLCDLWVWKDDGATGTTSKLLKVSPAEPLGFIRGHHRFLAVLAMLDPCACLWRLSV